MCKNNHFYLTTPIYYPSDNLHIGHAYTTVAADTLKRFKKQMGIDAYFLTGSDEHGQKIERKAKAVGKTPKAYVDEIVANIKSLWKLLNVDYDDYIRTTDDRHVKVVQKIFKQLYDQGDIYLSKYEGLYCTTCEAFYTELQLKDGCCPDCGKPVEKTQEEAYFLKLSKYQDWLIDHIETHPDFIQPVSRKNEMLNNFLRPGLADLCVSRTSVTWGIPVEFNPKHTVYVWIDALSNYISALGYGSEDTSLFDKYWPCDVHFVGKEIIRFHTIIWPIILHAIGLPVPKQIFGHGWLVMNGQKMSKSLGNVIDPVVLSNKYGADAVRYYLMRAIPFGSDGQFSYETFLTLINADLSNTLGNLLSRTVAMIEKYFGGQVQAPSAYTDVDKELIALALATPAKVEVKFNEFQFPQALEEIWNLVGECNKYIDVTEPWILGKTEEGKERLKAVLYVLAECIRFIAVLITANMPNTPAKIYLQLGIADTELTTWDSLQQFGLIKAGTQVQKLDAIFPRVDIK
ncbi:MAG: methionine--tRNA ligase, partial [Eubacteriales bacterium]|nr:methionine--tRNA ligase [Eubacteriales bacterium]